MKRILCYGDSNTWGYDPLTANRFDEHTRWTRVLDNSLGGAYEIIEEGLNGRTTLWDDPIEGYKSGKDHLSPCLESHRPLDLVVILLGTNDLMTRFSPSACDIAEGVRLLVSIVQGSIAARDGRSPQVLLLAPPPAIVFGEHAGMLASVEGKSLELSSCLARVAREMGCAFLDTGTIIVSSPLDGIHFEAEEHRKLGAAVALKVRELLE